MQSITMLADPKHMDDDRVGENVLAPLARTVLQSSPSGGVYARTAEFEQAVAGLSRIIKAHRAKDTEVLHFPPVMNRREVEKAGYLHSFPHLLGCVCGLHGDEPEIHAAVARFNAGEEWVNALTASDLVLTPAACYPVYPLAAARGVLPPQGLRFDVESYCFRRERTFEVDRLQATGCANLSSSAARPKRSLSVLAASTSSPN